MLTRVYALKPHALHARSSAALLKAAMARGCQLWIHLPQGQDWEEAGMMKLLMAGSMGLRQVELGAEGEGAEALLEELGELLAKL
jgi:phosphocarrier protein HPr